jgi:hypothetical protein
MASTVSSVQHHPVGLRLSRGAVAVRCTHTGSQGIRHLKTLHDQSVTLVPARQGKSRQILLQSTTTVCRQQELSTYLSLEYRQAIASHRLPPEWTIAD